MRQPRQAPNDEWSERAPEKGRTVNSVDTSAIVNYIDDMPDAVQGLVWETRRLFRVLAATADEALKPLEIAASERALIEFLAREPSRSGPPQLARKRSVSRQHIHRSLHRLRDPAWIEQKPDPNDARSALLHLTKAGRSLWKEIRAIDRSILRRIAGTSNPSRRGPRRTHFARFAKHFRGKVHD